MVETSGLVSTDHSDRYLNLAIIEIGEALSEIGTHRQRGARAGDVVYRPAQDKLMKAMAALTGKFWSPPIDPANLELGKKGS